MPKLYLILENGEVKEEDLPKCPSLAALKSRLGFSSSTMVEHVSVLWNRARCHMFVDEEGLYRDYLVNLKASAIYHNATQSRRGVPPYDDLGKDPDDFLAPDLTPIMGPAILWTGRWD